MPQQEMVTDRLVSVIQAIQLGRGTGTIVARRGEGPAAEEGRITFVKGQFTDARTGRYKGLEAFNVLSTWGRCAFTFMPADPNEHPIFFAVQQSPAQPGPHADPPVPPAFSPVSPLRHQGGQYPVTENSPNNVYPPPSNPLAAVPYPTREINSALPALEALGFSRAHRQVLLLVNGQRPISEIVRLTGRHPQETYKIIQDLERAMLVRIMYAR